MGYYMKDLHRLRGVKRDFDPTIDTSKLAKVLPGHRAYDRKLVSNQPRFEAKSLKKSKKFTRSEKTRNKTNYVSKDRWLYTHREFLRWKKTPEFEKWRHRQFLYQGGTCFYCDIPLQGIRTDVEHIVPKSKGGTNNARNLVLACWECNKKKYISSISKDDLDVLRVKNKKKKGTYHLLREQFPTEEDVADNIRQHIRES